MVVAAVQLITQKNPTNLIQKETTRIAVFTKKNENSKLKQSSSYARVRMTRGHTIMLN